MKALILIVAITLFWALTPIFILYTLVKYIFKPKKLGNYAYMVAFSIDQLGNVMGAHIMNDVLLKKEAVKKYGNPDETISHVTGVNYLAKTLTDLGYFVAHSLDAVDKNHVTKAAETNQVN